MDQSDTAYHAVTDQDNDKASDVSQRTLRPSSQWMAKLLIHLNLFLSLLWLAPIITLLYLNFSDVSIGASLWCPHGHCFFDPFTANSSTIANRYDHKAHNVLGVLQLVAKALEVWFIFVATGLVYTLATWLASRPSGLPLGLHSAHVEFSDLRLLFDAEFWQTPREVGHRNGEVQSRKNNRLLYFFVAICAVMCVLANLMGPAVAVLVLPTLKQRDTPQVNEAMYWRMAASSPPTGNSTIPFCTQNDFDNKTYACTLLAYGTTLDAWVASGKAHDYQIPYVLSRWPNGITRAADLFDASQDLFAVSQEWAVSFAFNASAMDHKFIAPNRQLLRNITADLENFAEVVADTREDFSPSALQKNQDPILRALVGKNDTGFVPLEPDNTFGQLKHSLQTQLLRSGPVVSTAINFYQASSWRQFSLGGDKYVLCSEGWSPLAAADPKWNGTKCLSVGSDWIDGRDMTITETYALTIPFLDVDSTKNGSVNMTLRMFWANQAAYFNESSGSDYGCFDNVSDSGHILQRADCDWDQFFGQSPPDYDYPYILSNVHTILIEFAGLATTNAADRFVIEFSPNSTIGEYSLDTSPFTNAIRLVEMVNPDPNNEPAESVYIHPLWLVAMFSGHSNDSPDFIDAHKRTAQYLSLSSIAAQEMAKTVSTIAADFKGASHLFDQVQKGNATAHYSYRSLFYSTYLTTLHLCSILSFDPVPIPDGPIPKDDQWRILYRRASILVWAYGIDSRTSQFGVAISIMGIVVVLLYVVLGLKLPTRIRSPTELLAAALARDSKAVDPYVEVNYDDDKVGRVRYITGRLGADDIWFEKVV